MGEVRALLIEDEAAQARRVISILEPIGFSVEVLATARAARERLTAPNATAFPVVIVDRRLPFDTRDEPLDSVGDDLLEFVCSACIDSLVIVLTGHADVPQVQTAMFDRGQLELEPGPPLNRVYHFEKTKYRAFGSFMQDFAVRYQSLMDYSVEGLDVTDEVMHDERLLIAKTLASYGGKAAIVSPLEGGLTGARVYLASIQDAEGSPVGRFIVKTDVKSDNSSQRFGNFHLLLDSRLVAIPFKRIAGFAGGREAQLIQFAGASAATLFEVLGKDESLAVKHLAVMRNAMDSALRISTRVIPVDQLVQPISSWDKLSRTADELSLPPISKSLLVPSTVSPQHGDLHAANVLVVGSDPILIDYDRETVASRILDPLTLALSTLFHPSSPVAGSDWMSAKPVNIGADDFLDGCPYPAWFSSVQEWIVGLQQSQREVDSLVLAYCLRQIAFPESKDRPEVVAWAREIARSAIGRLAE